MSPIYSKDQASEQDRYGLLAGALSGIAQNLGMMLRTPHADVPGDVVAELERMHKEATDALDAARKTFERKEI